MNAEHSRTSNSLVLLTIFCLGLVGARFSAAQFEPVYTYVDPETQQPMTFDTLSAAESYMRSKFDNLGQYLAPVDWEGALQTGEFPPTHVTHIYTVKDQPWTPAAVVPNERYESTLAGHSNNCRFDDPTCTSYETALQRLEPFLEECEGLFYSTESEEYWHNFGGGYVSVVPPGWPFEYTNYYSYQKQYVRRYEVLDLQNNGSCPDGPFITYEQDFSIHRRGWIDCPDGFVSNYYDFPNSGGPAANEFEYVCKADIPAQEITEELRQASSGSCVGNPCDPITGNKFLSETDYAGPTLEFTRTYNSSLQARGFAPGWSHNWEKRLNLSSQFDGDPLFAQRHNGSVVPLKHEGAGLMVSAAGSPFTIELTPGGGSTGEIILHQADGTQEVYDEDTGRLLREVDPAGFETTLVYETTAAPLQVRPRLLEVVGPFGHKLQFQYEDLNAAYGETEGRLSKVIDVGGNEISYDYDGSGNLEFVTYQDGEIRQYHYENNLNPAADLPHHLTGITDERTIRMSDYRYDDYGRANRTELAGGFERYTIQYDGSFNTVTDGDGYQKKYHIARAGNGDALMSAGVEIVGGANSTTSIVYDDAQGYERGRIATREDENGNVTSFNYGPYHLNSVTEASNDASLARTTSFSNYLNDLTSLPGTVTQPSVYGGQNKTTVAAYGGDLLVDTITESGFRPDGTAISRVFGFEYYSDAQQWTYILGRPLASIGPRTDVSERTEYTWYDCNTGAQCGQLASIKRLGDNGLILETTYEDYDADGRFRRVVDPNGLKTEFVYDVRGRVTFVKQIPITGAMRVTEFRYLPNGLLWKVVLPTTGEYEYAYNDAGLLMSITDSLGDRIEYRYDGRGNRITETYSKLDENSVRVTAFARQSEFDLNNHLDKIVSAIVPSDVDAATGAVLSGTTRDFLFDDVGNLVQDQDENQNPASIFVPDALNRLKDIADPVNGENAKTLFGYDVADNVASVTTPTGATTQLKYDDFGYIWQEVSPDRGQLDYVHDEAGNVTSIADARLVTVTYGYDSLNRIVRETYTDSCYDVTYTYDVAYDENGGEVEYDLGRLVRIDDHPAAAGNCHAHLPGHTGPLHIRYNIFGETTSVFREIGFVQYASAYKYDLLGNLEKLTYPSGREITYVRDVRGRVTQVDSTLGEVTSSVLTNVHYEPFGPLAGYDFGNGLNYERAHDLQYRSTQMTLADGGQSIVDESYGYDGAGNVTSIDDAGPANESSGFTYDALHRLDDATMPADYWDYAYDGNGNRLTLRHGADVASSVVEDAITIEPASNRINNITGLNGVITDYDYDAAGNLKHKLQPDSSGYVYYYNLPGRLDRIEYIDSNLDANDVGRYVYDALGRRFEKFTPAGATNSTRFWYDLSGLLLAEFDENGVILMEYIYLDGRPIAISGSDRDGDGVEDAFDNCVAEADVTQTDTNGDGYGNVCDPDLNNDGIVNPVDLGILRSNFFTSDPDSDLNLDGAVNAVDLGILKQFMFGPPGPAAPASGVNNALGTDLKYVHSNHLDKPMAVFDQQKNLDWEIDDSPFGRKFTVNAPALVLNLRFPGQYFDDESDLSYNYHRYYDPAIGRYITSDPIGLAGGPNTYSYGASNPLGFVDPLGLDVCYVRFLDYPVTISTSTGKTSTAVGGHAGVVGFDDQGNTRYYEYGRYHPDSPGIVGEALPKDHGNIRRKTIPDLDIGEDGKPTSASLEELLKELSRKAGKGTEAGLHCDSDADEAKTFAHILRIANDKDRKPYSWKPWNSNHCRTFALNAFLAGKR